MAGLLAKDFEVSLLARVLGKGEESLPADMAQYLLDVGFSRPDKERMHRLAIRNQDGDLSTSEKNELLAYARIGSVLSILQSKARRSLKHNRKRHTST